MYTIVDYIAMVGDRHRTGAYVRALEKMVTPDSVVLDLGAGFGFFAILAAKLGARHAYAIEPNDAIAWGPALARANGVVDRVTFIQDDSRHATLPERANLLIEDVRGALPLHGERIAMLRDARERLLTANARAVARRDRIWAAPARHAATMRDDLDTTGEDTHGVDLRPLRVHIVEASRRGKPGPDDMLLPAALLGELDLATVVDPQFDGTARWTPDGTIVADGFVLWFDAELAEGERFSSRPGPEQTTHGCLYLPLRDPLRVPARAELALRFRAVAVNGDYTWTWECAIAAEEGGEVVRTPRQSTLGALQMTSTRPAATSERHRPTLGLEGLRVREAIALIASQRQSGEIAAELARHPALGFTSAAESFEWLQRVMPLLESGSE